MRGDGLFQNVTKGLTCCIESIEEAECPEDCPYQRGCWDTDEGEEIDPMYLQLMKDAQALILEQQKRIEAIEKKYDALLDWRIAELKKQINDEREKLIRAGLWNEGSGNHGAG